MPFNRKWKKLNIFCAIGSKPNAGLSSSNIWHINLCQPLEDLGHKVFMFEFDLNPFFIHADTSKPTSAQFIKENRPRLEEELLRQVKNTHQNKGLDLFFSYFYSAFANPEVIKSISKLGFPTLNWYCNASYQFHLVSEIAPAYDYCLVPEKFRLTDYRRIGANPIYCQEAANPNFYKPYDLEYTSDITFVGGCYGDRPEFIKTLLNANLDVTAYGTGWQQLGASVSNFHIAERRIRNLIRKLRGRPTEKPFLPNLAVGLPLCDMEMVKMFSSSRISLGFTKVGETYLQSNPIKQVRLRDFEVPMSGAFYMVEQCDELEEFFIPNKEIVCFNDKAELIKKARYYLANDEERERIRINGYNRAKNEHTWQKRLVGVLRKIGLN